MRKFRILFGDLGYYNKYSRQTRYVPLNVGYNAQYARQLYGNDIEFRIFKDPAALLAEARANKPDMVALSFYYWNTDINHVLVQRLRAQYGDDLAIVWGGPSIGTDDREQQGLFERFPEVNAFVVNEGELGFANILKPLLSDTRTAWDNPIDGAVFQRDGRLMRGLPVGLTLDLDTLQSPYLTGVLDEFLAGDFMPMLQTSRLCPYTCAFCTSGKNRGKLRAFPLDQVKAEIDLISERFADRTHMGLLLSDENFGILARDVELAEYIREKSQVTGYPQSIFFYNDKRFTETSKKVIESLGKINTHGLILSLQSENPETLKEVKRKNLSPEDIKSALKWAAKRDMPTATELIFGMPYETRQSFLDLLNGCIARGFDSILVFNLFLMDGIELNTPSTRDRHGIRTMFRPVGTYYGMLDGSFCSEAEEIVVETKTFNFDDYLMIRSLGFMFYAVFALQFNRWFFQYLRDIGVDVSSFMLEFIYPTGDTKDLPAGHLAFSRDFRAVIKSELFETREEVKAELEATFRKNDGEVTEPIRQNVLYGARLIYLEREWVTEGLRRTLAKFVNPAQRPEVFERADFLLDLCERERVDVRDATPPAPLDSVFDLAAWKADKFTRPLEAYHGDLRRLTFRIAKDTLDRLVSFQRSFGDYDDLGYYYSAMDFMNRRELLYRLEYAG